MVLSGWMHYGIALTAFSAPALGQPGSQNAYPNARDRQVTVSADTRLDQVSIQDHKRIPADAHEAKIGDPLLNLRDRIRAERSRNATGPRWSELSVAHALRVNDHAEMQCYVHLADMTEAHRALLIAAGLREEIDNTEMRIIQGWMDDEALDRVARLPFVERITPPSYGRPRCAGSACTEGDAIHRADIVRTFGYDGSGVKVGCISDGVDSLNLAVLSGDLPNTVTVHPTLDGTGDEGIALMEIVHDLAPGAQLYFASGLTTVEMVQAINWLANTANVDVIVDDIGFYGEPYFADGSVAVAVRNAVTTSGAVYVTAAGNDCGYHYQGTYVDADGVGGQNLHDFKAGVGTDNALNVTVLPGETLDVYLQWDDPLGGSGNDYDLFAWDFTNNLQLTVTGGASVQNGNDDPAEHMIWLNNKGMEINVGILINKPGLLSAARTLELFTNLPLSDDDATCVDSIFGHPAVSEVISCVAVDSGLIGHGVTQPDSSQGPSTLKFPSNQVRNTPFLTAVDNVEVSGAGSFPTLFGGTSAAAPHVAGVAALLLDIVDLSYSPAQTRNMLAASAVDIDDPGYEFTSGHGRVDALLTYFDLFPPACCPTTISSYPYLEDFDGESLCTPTCGEICTLTGDWLNQYTDIDNDGEDWIVHEGPTPSVETGPSADHTTGAANGKYLYTEVSGALCTETSSILLSPCFDLSSLTNPELRFWYHMVGASMGMLKVEVSDNNCGTWTPVFSISGNQGDLWQQGVVNLAPFGNTVRVRFVGQRGLSFSSDMAIDDISIAEACIPPTAPTSATFQVDDFCPAESGTVELMATGGSGGDVHWYDIGCGFGPIGTGDSLIVDARSTPTTYYARRESTCGLTTCVNVAVPADVTAPTLLSAVSRIAHDGQGELDLAIPPGVFTSEPRVGGPRKLVLTFSEAITASDAVIDANQEVVIERDGVPDASLIESVTHTCNEITVSLSQVPDESCLRIVIAGIQDAAGNAFVPPADLELVALEGDANNTGGVTISDLSTIKSASGQFAGDGYHRMDINLTGGVTISDLSNCKARLGNFVTCNE